MLKLNPKTKRRLGYLMYAGILIIGIVLLFLPADFFDEGDSLCLSVVLFNTECYGCGMTRGVQHLLHFNFAKAWEYNKLSIIVLPLMTYLIITSFWKFHKEGQQTDSEDVEK